MNASGPRYAQDLAKEHIRFEELLCSAEIDRIAEFENQYWHERDDHRLQVAFAELDRVRTTGIRRTADWKRRDLPRNRSAGSPQAKVRRFVRRSAVAAMLLVTAAPAALAALSFVAPAMADQIVANAVAPFVKQTAGEVEAERTCNTFLPVYEQGSNAPASHISGGIGCSAVQFGKPVSQQDLDVVLPAYEAVEGVIAGRGVILNSSLVGLARGAKGVLTGDRVGGSTLSQSNVEALAGRSGELGVFGKVHHLFRGLAFHATYLVQHDKRRAFAVGNAVCANGMPGTGPGFLPRAGNACAAIFGKTRLQELTLAQACFLASTAKRQLRVPGSQSQIADYIAYQARIDWLKERAATRCATKLAEGASLEQLVHEIRVLELADPPEMRAKLINATPVDLMTNTLIREFNVEVDAWSTGVRLTLRQDIQREVLTLTSDLGEEIYPYVNDELCLTGCSDDRIIDVALFVAEHRHGTLTVLSAVETRRGLLNPEQTDRSIASLNKALALPILETEGIKTVCKRRWGGLKDFDGNRGGSCENSNEYMTVRRAFAESSNLALIDGLLRVNDSNFKSYLRQLGYEFDASLDHASLVHGFVLGYITSISLTDFAVPFAGLAFGQEVVRRPTLDANDFYDGLNLEHVIRHAELRGTIDAMGAPVTDRNGTAKAAAPILANAGCQLRVAKTGTSDSEVKDAVRDKLFAIAATCNGREFVAIGMVGSPNIHIPVGKISSGTVVRWVTKSLVAAAK